jgi:glyoxylase-like metal-dependent hydrolase (beta-lactamase superfamily II)
VNAADVIPLHVSDVTYPEGHPLAGQTGSVMAFAIRRPDGIVLVDTGIGFGNEWIDENYQPRSRPIREALRAAALDADLVRAVINTHLHFDHSGQNAAFARVPIFVQQPEWDVGWDEGYTITEWLDFDGAGYERVRGDVEIAPGIRLLATPGHTPGHQSVTVETDDGLVLIVGQAAQDARDFANTAGDGTRAEGAAASLTRLRELNATLIHFSHDRAVLKRTPRERPTN